MTYPSTVVVAADHAGYPLKEYIKHHLEQAGVTVVDVGTHSEESVDYPPLMRAACAAVLRDGVPGLIFGGSGNGEAMAANKVPGIRAALVYSIETAQLARAHNDANVASFGARLTTQQDAQRYVDIFLSTPFDGGRHARRIADLDIVLSHS